ncbi:MAG TPA: hypothetical protein VD886_24875, partial [Herpetosiphonaceae bacterium]|nr:hypothetical protein [Herpetosiphonaceae bacterium]
MNVVITEDTDSLTIMQRYGLGYKLQRLFLLLLLGVLLPIYALYFSGTAATLTCAREAGAGIVCTDRLNWLGAFRRAWRYERVEQAYVPGNSPYLHLKTADGFARFSSIHHARYTRFADPVNAFVQNPAAGTVVMSDPINVEVGFISSVILLASIYR